MDSLKEKDSSIKIKNMKQYFETRLTYYERIETIPNKIHLQKIKN